MSEKRAERDELWAKWKVANSLSKEISDKLSVSLAEEAKRRGRMHTRCPSSQILPPTVRVFCALEMAT